MEDDLKKQTKNRRRPQQKNENERQPQFFFEKLEWRPPQNGRRPQTNKMEDASKNK